MLIISYDIKRDKLRRNFNKFIKKYGSRLQFSVYKIKNSQRVLDIILVEIEDNYSKLFSEDDSIIIFNIHDDKIIRYGYAKHDEDDIIIVD